MSTHEEACTFCLKDMEIGDGESASAIAVLVRKEDGFCLDEKAGPPLLFCDDCYYALMKKTPGFLNK